MARFCASLAADVALSMFFLIWRIIATGSDAPALQLFTMSSICCCCCSRSKAICSGDRTGTGAGTVSAFCEDEDASLPPTAAAATLFSAPLGNRDDALLPSVIDDDESDEDDEEGGTGFALLCRATIFGGDVRINATGASAASSSSKPPAPVLCFVGDRGGDKADAGDLTAAGGADVEEEEVGEEVSFAVALAARPAFVGVLFSNPLRVGDVIGFGDVLVLEDVGVDEDDDALPAPPLLEEDEEDCGADDDAEEVCPFAPATAAEAEEDAIEDDEKQSEKYRWF